MTIFTDALLVSAAICSTLHNISIPIIDDLNFNLWSNYTKVSSLNIGTSNDSSVLCEEIKENALNCFEVLFGSSEINSNNNTEIRKFFYHELNSTKEDLSRRVNNATSPEKCHKTLVSVKTTDMIFRNMYSWPWLKVRPRAVSALRKLDPTINPAAGKRESTFDTTNMTSKNLIIRIIMGSRPYLTVERNDSSSNQVTESSEENADIEIIFGSESDRHKKPVTGLISESIRKLLVLLLMIIAAMTLILAITIGNLDVVYKCLGRFYQNQRNDHMQRLQMAIELAPVPAAAA